MVYLATKRGSLGGKCSEIYQTLLSAHDWGKYLGGLHVQPREETS